jgi:hypothetical protein
VQNQDKHPERQPEHQMDQENPHPVKKTTIIRPPIPYYYSTSTIRREHALLLPTASSDDVKQPNLLTSLFVSPYCGTISSEFLNKFRNVYLTKFGAEFLLLFALVFFAPKAIDSIAIVAILVTKIIVYLIEFYEILAFIQTSPSNPPLVYLDWLQTGQNFVNEMLRPFRVITDALGPIAVRCVNELLLFSLLLVDVTVNIPPLSDFPNLPYNGSFTSILQLQYSSQSNVELYSKVTTAHLVYIFGAVIISTSFASSKPAQILIFVRRSTGFRRFKQLECNRVQLNREIRLFSIIAYICISILCPIFFSRFIIAVLMSGDAATIILLLTFGIYAVTSIALVVFFVKIFIFIYCCEPTYI